MFGVKERLIEEYNYYAGLVELEKQRLQNAPDGHLRISYSNGCPQFYHVVDAKQNKNGVYISRKQEDFTTVLAQKEYDERILKLSERRMRQLSGLIKEYQNDEIERVYLDEHIEKKKRIIPVEKPWAQRIEEWMNIPYQGKSFSEGTPVILTEKGERVRSKSEKILADFFLKNNIPYKYECPLTLKGFGTVYPDFTLLSKKMNAEVYLEHEGMMDNPQYAEAAVKKIKTYERNGIFQGERLIITFETSHELLDMKILENLIKKVL